jgi:hypothetical protein
MNRLKLPLMFVFIITMALLSSCSTAALCAESNLATIGILGVTNGRDAYLLDGKAKTNEVAIQWYRVLKDSRYIVETMSGINPVIKTSFVAAQFNTSNVEPDYALLMEKKGDIFGRQEMNVAWETLVRGLLPVMPGNVGHIDYAVISATSSITSNDGAISTTAYAMHDKILTGDMLGRGGTIWGKSEVLKIPIDVATISQIRARISNLALVMERNGDIMGTINSTMKPASQIDAITINSSPASYA